ncbi:MAG: TonB-dependent receptor [Muribaculaceae bacterium]|nr:TonB-dependent receptor [Muribaculaceae bacterium]
MRLRCPFLLLLSSLVPLRSLSGGVDEPRDTLLTLDELAVSAVKIGSQVAGQPLAATIMGRDIIEDLDITSIKSVSEMAPNFYMPDYGSRITSSLYVRGFGSRIDQPVIGFNIDNIPILNRNNFDFDIQDLERVEIIRGAQSAMYGRNSMTGVMNFFTLSPMRFQGWTALASFGSSNQWKTSVGWYGLLHHKFALSAVASIGGVSGYWINQYNGAKVDKEKQGMFRLRGTYHSSWGWTIDNSFITTLNRQGGYPYESLSTGEISYNDTCFYKRVGILDGLTVKGTVLNGLGLTSVTSYQYLDDNMTLDQDFLPQDYFTLSQRTRESGFTQDLILKKPELSVGYSWLDGLFAWGKWGRMDAPVVFKDTGIRELIEHYRNEANPDYPIHWNDREFLIDTRFYPSSWGLSAYHESKYKTKNWTFSASLRFDYERAILDYMSTVHTSYTIYNAATGEVFKKGNIDIDEQGKLTHDYIRLLPKITALYHWDSSSSGNVYLNISEGYKPGGFNTQMFSDVMQQKLRQQLGLSMLYDIEEIVSYEPEKTWNFEVGFHVPLKENHLRLSGALFYIDCHDQQLTMFPAGTTTGRIMGNAGHSRSLGAEFTADWDITPKWNVGISAGLADARFIRFNDGIDDFSGKHVPYAPLTTTFAQCTFETPIKALNLWFEKCGFTLSAKGTGPVWWDESNILKQNYYELLNLNIRLSKGPITLEGWMENITGTKYSTFYFKSIGNEFVQRGYPFRGGVRVKLSI